MGEPQVISNRTWSELGFWRYTCGCAETQDGWERCGFHTKVGGKPPIYGPYDTFVVKDSGEREQFASGMVRDTAANKIDFWRVYVGPMLQRWADHLTKGATKYPDVAPGVSNWTLAAGQEEMQRFKASAARHFAQWMRGDVDEDHAAAVYFNINGYEYVKERLEGK